MKKLFLPLALLVLGARAEDACEATCASEEVCEAPGATVDAPVQKTVTIQEVMGQLVSMALEENREALIVCYNGILALQEEVSKRLNNPAQEPEFFTELTAKLEELLTEAYELNQVAFFFRSDDGSMVIGPKGVQFTTTEQVPSQEAAID